MTEVLSEHELSIEEYGKKSLLRPTQREELERSIAGIEERLAQPILLEMAGGDREALEKQLLKERAMLDSGTPPHLDVAGQRRVYAKMKKCEELIINGLPTFTMMERGRPADVDHHVAHENAQHHDEDGHYTTKRAILAWKNYRLTLDPRSVEPNFLSIASLRTDTVRGNPALFRKNYDHIKFRELIEENLAEQLDDETYFLFCGLKTLDWAEATICRKLDWTQKMYDSAMARFLSDMKESQPVREEVNDNYSLVDNDYSENGDQPSLSNPAYAVVEMENGKDTKDRGEREHKVSKHLTGAALHKSYETRVQIESGWPRAELHDLGISTQEFCREWGTSPTLFYKFTKEGKWVERHLRTARAALARLAKKRRSEPALPGVRKEPGVSGEPELVYDSTEPVAASTAIARTLRATVAGKPV